jgi:hypothetical protein
VFRRPTAQLTDAEEARVIDKTIGRTERGFRLLHGRLKARQVSDVELHEAMRHTVELVNFSRS